MWNPLLDLNAELTWNFSRIYYVGVNGFNDFVHYLYTSVYDHAINYTVLNWSVAFFFFMLFTSFVVWFIFLARR